MKMITGKSALMALTLVAIAGCARNESPVVTETPTDSTTSSTTSDSTVPVQAPRDMQQQPSQQESMPQRPTQPEAPQNSRDSGMSMDDVNAPTGGMSSSSTGTASGTTTVSPATAPSSQSR